MAKASKRKSSRPPWKRSNPRKLAGKASKDLSPARKASAKRRAKAAGRPYPNLVDNMREASKKKTRKRAASRKRTIGRSASKSGKR